MYTSTEKPFYSSEYLTAIRRRIRQRRPKAIGIIHNSDDEPSQHIKAEEKETGTINCIIEDRAKAFAEWLLLSGYVIRPVCGILRG